MERTVEVEWRGRPVRAADPAPIAEAAIELGATTVRRTERAAGAVAAVARATPAAEAAGRLLLRAEGLASSAIEGLSASAEEVAASEVSDARTGVGAWVVDNLAAVTDALATPAPIDTPTLHLWHRRLMRHAPAIDPRHVGAWRDVLGWVGGPNPLVAAHVATPPHLLAPAVDDLVSFLRRDDLDPITVAAIAHAQFETIHPYADGNGRIGRILTGWVLRTRIGATHPPPVSNQFARDIGGYLAGLAQYRQGQVDDWVRWFADTVATSAERTGEVLDVVDDLLLTWAQATSHLRVDAAARRLLPLLPAHPVVNAQVVAALLDVSEQAARHALRTLEDADVLTASPWAASGGGRPTRWWRCDDLLALLGR